MKKFFKSIDILTPPENLRFNNSPNYKSCIGGFLTIIFFSFSGLFIFEALYYFFFDENSLIRTGYIFNNNDFFNFSKKDLEFFFNLQFSNGTIINLKDSNEFNKYISISSVFKDEKKILNSFSSNYPMNSFTNSPESQDLQSNKIFADLVKCDQLYSEKEIKFFPITNYFCFNQKDFNNSLDDDLNKNKIDFEVKFSRKFYLQIEKCKNETNSNTSFGSKNKNNSMSVINKKDICKSDKEITHFIDDISINIQVPNNFINDDKGKINMKLYEFFYEKLNDLNSLNIKLNFNKLIYEIKNGLFFQKAYNNIYFILRDYNTYYVPNLIGDKPLLNLEIKSSNKDKKLMKIIKHPCYVLGIIGGLVKIFSLMALTIYYIFYRSFKIIDHVNIFHKESINSFLKHMYIDLKNSKIFALKNVKEDNTFIKNTSYFTNKLNLSLFTKEKKYKELNNLLNKNNSNLKTIDNNINDDVDTRKLNQLNLKNNLIDSDYNSQSIELLKNDKYTKPGFNERNLLLNLNKIKEERNSIDHYKESNNINYDKENDYENNNKSYLNKDKKSQLNGIQINRSFDVERIKRKTNFLEDLIKSNKKDKICKSPYGFENLLKKPSITSEKSSIPLLNMEECKVLHTSRVKGNKVDLKDTKISIRFRNDVNNLNEKKDDLIEKSERITSTKKIKFRENANIAEEKLSDEKKIDKLNKSKFSHFKKTDSDCQNEILNAKMPVAYNIVDFESEFKYQDKSGHSSFIIKNNDSINEYFEGNDMRRINSINSNDFKINILKIESENIERIEHQLGKSIELKEQIDIENVENEQENNIKLLIKTKKGKESHELRDKLNTTEKSLKKNDQTNCNKSEDPNKIPISINKMYSTDKRKKNIIGKKGRSNGNLKDLSKISKKTANLINEKYNNRYLFKSRSSQIATDENLRKSKENQLITNFENSNVPLWEGENLLKLNPINRKFERSSQKLIKNELNKSAENNIPKQMNSNYTKSYSPNNKLQNINESNDENFIRIIKNSKYIDQKNTKAFTNNLYNISNEFEWTNSKQYKDNHLNLKEKNESSKKYSINILTENTLKNEKSDFPYGNIKTKTLRYKTYSFNEFRENYVKGKSIFSLFCTYWCANRKKNGLKNIYINKEKNMDFVLSVENISKLHFDLQFMKILLLDKPKIFLINHFYDSIFSEEKSIRDVSNFIYEKNVDSIEKIFFNSTEDRVKILKNMLA